MPINLGVAPRSDPAMDLAANAITSDVQYAVDDISLSIPPDGDDLGCSEDDAVPDPDVRHG